MKQFSLKEYLKNPSRKVVTRDGRKVRIICTDAKGNCPVVGLVDYENYEVALNVTRNGKIDGVSDLFFAPEKHEGWVNVHKAGNTPYLDSCIWPAEEEAKKWANDDYVATVKIKWEE